MKWKKRRKPNGRKLAMSETENIVFILHDELNDWFYFSVSVASNVDIQQEGVMTARFMKNQFSWQDALNLAEKIAREIDNERH